MVTVNLEAQVAAMACALALLAGCGERESTWNRLLAGADSVAVARVEELVSAKTGVSNYRSTVVSNSTACQKFLLGLKNVNGKNELVPLNGAAVRCFFLGADGREVLCLSVNIDGATVLLYSQSLKRGYAVYNHDLARRIVKFAREALGVPGAGY